jgi:hypothetical protein
LILEAFSASIVLRIIYVIKVSKACNVYVLIRKYITEID